MIKICNKTLFFALIFILADIYLLLMVNQKTITSPFVDSLDVGKKSIYKNIVNERTMIYIKSVFIALFISLLYYFALPKNNFFKPKNMTKFSVASVSLIIFYFVTYLSYILHAKSDYMVLHLDSETERIEWLKVYKTMQFQYHLSFVFGFIGISILYYGIC
tara:strand:+ start:3168 stop:3650 length:483 start_codon:yes stop_codon:yes gene_type:complete